MQKNERFKRNLAYYEKALARAKGVSRCRTFESLVNGTVDCCDFSDDTNSDESDRDDDTDENEDNDEDDDTDGIKEDKENDDEEYEEDDEPSKKNTY